MREVSVDDYNRKFGSCIAYVTLEGENRPEWVYIQSVGRILENGNVRVLANRFLFLHAGAVEPQNFNVVDFHYKLPERRYYQVMGEDHYAALWRKNRKSYHVGLNDRNWYAKTAGGQDPLGLSITYLNMNSPLDFNPEESLRKERGLITPRIFLRDNTVFYLGKSVGRYKGRKFLVDDWILQEIKDGFRGLPVDVY